MHDLVLLHSRHRQPYISMSTCFSPDNFHSSSETMSTKQRSQQQRHHIYILRRLRTNKCSFERIEVVRSRYRIVTIQLGTFFMSQKVERASRTRLRGISPDHMLLIKAAVPLVHSVHETETPIVRPHRVVNVNSTRT